MRTNNSKSFADMMDNGVLGLCGEAGEVADLLKKARFQGHSFNRDKMLEELGDVQWYVALCCEALNVPLEEVMQKNIDKLKARYSGEGFSAEESVNRDEYKLTSQDMLAYKVSHPTVKAILDIAKVELKDGINVLVFDKDHRVQASIVSRKLEEMMQFMSETRGKNLMIAVEVEL